MAKTSRLFESIVENSPVPMVVASVEGKLIAMNKVCMEQLGITEAAVGSALIDFRDQWKHYDRDGNPISIINCCLHW